MRFSTIHIVVGWLCFCIGGCAWLGTETPPEWIVSSKRLYPPEQFLTGMGEGSNRDQAEKRAYAAVARIFSAKVQAQSFDQESYAIQETGETSRTQRTLQLEQRTQVTTNKVLKNVKILDVWYQPSTRRFFALAGLDRQQAQQAIMDRLKDWDLSIESMVEQGRVHPQKIQRIRGYKQALTQLMAREYLNAELQVIRPSGESHPPPYRIPDLQQEFQDFVSSEVVISVSMDGENSEEMERAILGGLKQEGLHGHRVSGGDTRMSRTEDVVIIGHAQLWTIDLPDPLFKYVRWCSDIDIYEQPSRRLIGVISETGREGHVTEREAKVRANGAMQEVVSRAVARVLTQSIFDIKQNESKTPSNSRACPQ